ncbi:hypothetical protein BT69DRAFT_1344355 [Atractiella rhizophila]|nr:hypothetical protein BT69DRAFT_1344355 [Atractiella rhizophila]
MSTNLSSPNKLRNRPSSSINARYVDEDMWGYFAGRRGALVTQLCETLGIPSEELETIFGESDPTRSILDDELFVGAEMQLLRCLIWVLENVVHCREGELKAMVNNKRNLIDKVLVPTTKRKTIEEVDVDGSKSESNKLRRK